MLKRILFLSVVVVSLASCGTTTQPTDPRDPYENTNRHVFAFNVVGDRLFLKPAATVYMKLVPNPVQKGVHNAYQNVGELTIIPNDILQGKPMFLLSDCFRLIINSTVGVLGLFDVAQHMNMPYHPEDFGMTLAYWEGSTRPTYVMLPLLGPNDMRGSVGLPFDYLMNPVRYYLNTHQQIVFYAGKYISMRADYLSADKMVEQAFDPYAFVRGFYLEHREQQLRDNELTFAQFLKQENSGSLQ